MKTSSHWQRIGMRPHHGICLPLFSLRNQSGTGIGDFGDLLPLIDWCHQVGFDCIQLLPLNDSGDDPSPYNALSSCALDPIYINLRDLPNGLINGDFAALNELARIPHNEVKQQKLKWLFKYFEENFAPSAEYNLFLRENPWIHSYALFKACKDEYGNKYWGDWPKEKQSPTTCSANPKEIDFHCFLQYLAFSQLKKAKLHAEKKSIFLKGDIPILVSPDSADVWAKKELFNLTLTAGAPPDRYNHLGQKWGFPLFDWDEMRKTHFAWWKERLGVAEQFYHLYRIDHVVGFFRIWAIAKQAKPAQGKFIPHDEHLWGPQGRELLEMMLRASPLLPIAEDLGVIPQVVYQTLHEFGIPGTKVMRWQRRWDSDGGFIDPKEYPRISLTTISTPDMEPLGLFWEKFPQEASLLAEFKHWTYAPKLEDWQRKELLRDSHHSGSLFHINLLEEYLALFPSLVSPNPEDERINIPGTQLPTNWTYRFKPTLEELINHQELTEAIRAILAD